MVITKSKISSIILGTIISVSAVNGMDVGRKVVKAAKCFVRGSDSKDYDQELFDEMKKYTFENYKIIRSLEEVKEIFKIKKLKQKHLATFGAYVDAFQNPCELFPLVKGLEEKIKAENPDKKQREIWSEVLHQLDLDKNQLLQLTISTGPGAANYDPLLYVALGSMEEYASAKSAVKSAVTLKEGFADPRSTLSLLPADVQNEILKKMAEQG